MVNLVPIGTNLFGCDLGNVQPATAQVRVGGTTPSKFLPNLNAAKWNDETWLNINHPATVVTNELVTFDGKIVALTVGEVTHKYYTLDDGHVEWNIILSKKPKTNQIIFEVSQSPNLVWCYQDTLENDWKNGYHIGTEPGCTLEEYLQKHHRPDNVVGSYAIYGNKRNNQYATGKFGHIYRPQVFDANGQSTWADLHFDPINNVLTVTIPQPFLNTARYPISHAAGLIMGYNTQGGSTGGSSDRSYANRCETICNDTAAASGTVTKCWFYANNNWSASYSVEVGVYAWTGTDPGDLLGTDAAQTIVGAANQWLSKDVSGLGWSISNGSIYLAAAVAISGPAGPLTYDTSLGDGQLWYRSATQPLADPWNTTSDAIVDQALGSMYFEYEPSGGGNVPEFMRTYRNFRTA